MICIFGCVACSFEADDNSTALVTAILVNCPGQGRFEKEEKDRLRWQQNSLHQLPLYS